MYNYNKLSTCTYIYTVFKKDFGPGPAHFVDPSVTRSGPEGTPRYSIGSRHKELMPFNTPGPGSYAPEQSKTCFQREKKDPSYSIGSRTKYRKSKAMLEQCWLHVYVATQQQKKSV